MLNKMDDIGRSINDGEIKNLEFKINKKLPDDYINFLKKYNGGIPVPGYFPMEDNKNDPIGHIKVFLGINDSIESCNIDWNYNILLGRIPENLLPIANDDCGNSICISLSGRDKGYIYFWEHSKETNPPNYSNVYLVSKAFQIFIDSLYFFDPLSG